MINGQIKHNGKEWVLFNDDGEFIAASKELEYLNREAHSYAVQHLSIPIEVNFKLINALHWAFEARTVINENPFYKPDYPYHRRAK